LAVYGRAVQHGHIPLAYAVDVIAEHGLLTYDGEYTRAQRLEIAREQLLEWEDALVESEWPTTPSMRNGGTRARIGGCARRS
jgi:hypothetical protein